MASSRPFRSAPLGAGRLGRSSLAMACERAACGVPESAAICRNRLPRWQQDAYAPIVRSAAGRAEAPDAASSLGRMLQAVARAGRLVNVGQLLGRRTVYWQGRGLRAQGASLGVFQARRAANGTSNYGPYVKQSEPRFTPTPVRAAVDLIGRYETPVSTFARFGSAQREL